MGGSEDFLNEESGEEVNTEESGDENSEAGGASDKLAELQATVDRLSAQITLNQGAPQTQAPQKPRLTQEQIAAIQKNPALLVDIMEQNAIAVEKKVTGQMQQQHWDDRAYKDFPGLNGDKKFQEAVTKEIQGLVSLGTLTKEHPQLLYQAARLAAGNYKPATGGNSAVKKPANAIAPGSRQKATAPNETEDRNSPENQLLRMAGWSMEKIKKAKENHKNRQVSTRTAPNGGTRRVISLGRDK